MQVDESDLADITHLIGGGLQSLQTLGKQMPSRRVIGIH